MPRYRKTRQAEALFNYQGGKCYWCGVGMVLPRHEPPKRHRPVNSLLCTLEHMDSKYSLERGKHHGEKRNVAACWGCNNTRAREEELAIPVEIRQQRSGRHKT